MTTVTSRNFDLGLIADSGQCFRMRRLSDGKMSVISGDARVVAAPCGISRGGEYTYELDCTEEEYESRWRGYFDLDTDYSPFVSASEKEGGFLAAAAKVGGGIRILRQQPFETLISFIISQRKNIPAIMNSVEALCRYFGEPRQGGGGDYHAFPTPEALASASLAELSACSLGYRVPYILRTSQLVACGALDLSAIDSLGDDDLLARLMGAPGVGPKVANCVSLFAYHRLAAFPRDVWINRIIDEQFGGSFDPAPFNGFAGVVQQYMFYYGRRGTQQ